MISRRTASCFYAKSEQCLLLAEPQRWWTVSKGKHKKDSSTFSMYAASISLTHAQTPRHEEHSVGVSVCTNTHVSNRNACTHTYTATERVEIPADSGCD